MNANQQKQFAQNTIDQINSFISDIEYKLQNLGSVEWVVVMRSGLPLKWDTDHDGRLTVAEQTGTMEATRTTNRALASRVAHNVKCGKGVGGKVMTFAQLLEETKESQQKALSNWELVINTIEENK